MFISFLRSFVLYLLLILCVRLMGKRQIGEMEPSEFVMTMLLANLAANPMQDSALSLASGLVPILTVLSMELILAYVCLRSIRIRKFFCGRPIILIENGKISQRNLQRTRITLDELSEHLREGGILDLSTVRYAILETNGQISTFLYSKDLPPKARDLHVQAEDDLLPYTLISDGHILRENLIRAGRDLEWLEQTLQRIGCTADAVFLLTVDDRGKLYLSKKERTS